MRPPYIPIKRWLLPSIILLMLAVGSVARCYRVQKLNAHGTTGR
jgi:hypothetical protein